jgi:hypothetical protein
VQSSSTRTWTLPALKGDNGPGDAITEPSGTGAFAEAMRELIAQLTPVPQKLREAQAQPFAAERPRPQAQPRAAVLSHLRLVR